MRVRQLLVPLAAMMVAVVALLLPSSALAAQVKLAVLEFAAAPGTGADWSSLGKGFQEMILVDLSKAGSVDVVERRAVREQQLALGLALPGSEGERRNLGQQSGATHVLSGGFSVKGNQLTLTAELLDVGGGKVLLTHTVDGEAEAFFELEKDVVQASIGALDLSLSARERAETGRLHTADFLAFQDFSRGLDEFDAEKYEASLRSLRSAAERDTQFSLAAITLDEYTRLIDSIRDKADAIEVVKNEQKRLEKLAEVSEDVEVLRRLLDIARKEGPQHQRERLAALHLLAIVYSNEAGFRGYQLGTLRRREDKFAIQRAGDEMWTQYHREAKPLWPKVPVQVDDTFFTGFPALETFDKDFQRNVAALWEKGSDYPDNRIKYLQDNLRYPRNTGKYAHLSVAEQTQLHHDFYMTYAPRVPVKDYYYDHEADELLKAYRVALRFDDSTRLLKKLSDKTDNEHRLRSYASLIEDNKTLVQLLRGAPDRARMEEFMLLAFDDGFQVGQVTSLGEKHFSTKGPLSDDAKSLLARFRDWPAADRGWVRLGQIPAWCVARCYEFWTGPRTDPRVADAVRYYRRPGGDMDTDPLLMLDSAPRKDVDIGFTLDWTVADDFGPSRFEPTKEEPAVSLLLRAVDIDVDKYEDPHTKERTIERPMNAAQVTFTRDRIVVATIVENDRKLYHGKFFAEDVVKEVKLKKGIADGARIGVTVKGEQLTVLVDGKSVLTTKVKTAPAGFTGFRMTGPGYVEVKDVVLSGIGGA